MAMLLQLLWLEELRRLEERRQSRRRLRLRNQLEVLADQRDFLKLYRLTPHLFEELCREIAPLLPQHKRSDHISPDKKIMTALAFYASGSYKRPGGGKSRSHAAQQTLALVVHQVTAALNNRHILAKYIRFPQNKAEREEIKLGFFQKFGMPGAIGCIDCTHVAIKCPRDDEYRFFNRKYYHSRNVQIICDSNSRITSVDASFGGASNDSYVFHQSQVKTHLEQLHEDTWMLGDSGYPLRKFLMTPIKNVANNTPEGRYNRIQKSARTTMKRTLELLKGRWRCLLAARDIQYHHITAARIVNACCVLHNYCHARPSLQAPPLSARDLRLERYFQERPNEVVVSTETAAAELRAGKLVQDNLVISMEAGSDVDTYCP